MQGLKSFIDKTKTPGDFEKAMNSKNQLEDLAGL